MPDMDEGAFVLDYFLPAGTSLAETDKVVRRVEADLLDTPGVAGYLRRTGAENGLFATESYTAKSSCGSSRVTSGGRWSRSSTRCAGSWKPGCPS